MRKYILLLFIFVLSNKAFAEINFDITPSKITIKITNLQKMLKEQDPKLRHFLSLDTYGLPESLIFPVALQPQNDINITYKFSNETNSIIPKNQFIEKIEQGLRRGAKIVSIRVPLISQNDEKSFFDNFEIDIKLRSKIPFIDNKIYEYEKSFFGDIVNTQHLAAILNEIYSIKKYSERIQSPNWYNPEQKYLKIETDANTIVELKGEDVLAIFPEWNGKLIKGFHLLYLGQDYPIYITSENEYFSGNSRIYFLGRLATGDTTYLDTYTNNAPFYLYYDQSKQPLRLTEWSWAPAESAINSVNINYHIEQDREYFGGTNDIYSRTDYLEGWYWAKLHRFKEWWEEQLFGFKHYLPIMPSDDDTLEIAYNFATLNISLPGIGLEYKGKDPRQKYFFHTIFNKDTANATFVDRWTDSLAIFRRLGKEIYAGLNELKILNRRIDSANGLLGVNYFLLRGKAKPFPIGGFVQFDVLQLSSNSNLKLNGMNSSKICFIDTLNNQIGFADGVEGYRFAASAGENAVSFVINDSCVYLDSAFVFAYKNLQEEIKYVFFKDNINVNLISSVYNQLPTNSFVLFANNLKRSLPADLRSFLQNLGSSEIINISTKSNWVFAFAKGKLEKFEASSPAIATVDGFVPQTGARSYQFELSFEADRNYSLFVNSDISYQKPNLKKVSSSNLRNSDIVAELIIITHNEFSAQAQKYSQYRHSKGISNVVIDVEDIYKEFSFGKKSPHAIKKFLQYAYSNWQKRPKYVLLIGDASWDNRKLLPKSKSSDFIPSYGFPVSDYWFGLLEGDDFEPELIVGRIPAQFPNEIENYMEKIVTFENQPNAKWMKKFLFLSGGDSELQRRSFASYRYNVFDKVEPYPICAETAWVGIRNFNAGSEEQMNEILSHLNSGTIWTFFFGHASSQVFDLDGWQVEYMNNKGRCGFLSTLSCNAGAFAEPFDLHSRNEQYVLAKDNGFIVAYGSSGVGMVEGALALMTYMVDGMADVRTAHRRAGDILLYGKTRLDPTQWVYYVTRDLVNLLGDPTVAIRLGDEPDLFIPREDLKIKSNQSERISEDEKFAIVSGSIFNNGYALNSPLYVRLIRKYKNQTDTLFQNFNIVCNKIDFQFELPIENMAGEHFVELFASGVDFQDKNFADNALSTSFYVYAQNIIPLDPQSNWNVSSNNPVFRFINTFSNKQVSYDIQIISIFGNDTSVVARSNLNEIKLYDGYLDWKPQLQLEDAKSYILRYKVDDLSTGAVGYYSHTPFYAKNNSIEQTQLRFANKTDYSDVNFDGATITENTLQVENPAINFSLLSINGVPTGEFDSWVNITLGKDIYIDHRYYRGFNVVVIPKNQRNPKGRYYRYDTWEHAEDARQLVRLLRDSVSVDDYVLIATCNQSFRAFEELVPRVDFAYIDSLRSLLATIYNSKVATNLASNKSFVYAGGKYMANIIEAINDFDSAAVQGKLTFFPTEGSAMFDCESPARKWNSFKITGRFDKNENFETHLKFISKDKLASKDTTLLGLGTFDLSNIPAEKFPFMQKTLKIKKDFYTNNNKIDTILVDFQPTEELLLASANVSKPDILRGDTAHIQLKIRNISLRTDADKIFAEIELKDNFNEAQTYNIDFLNRIKRNDSIFADLLIPTEKLSGEVQANIAIRTKNQEQFTFNNIKKLRFKTVSDTIKPWIIAKFDGKSVKTGDYISNQPVIEVELYDNSLLPIVRQSDILVRINGVMQTPERCKQYTMETFGATRPLKARLTIIPDTLKESDNSVLIYFSDASSNRDTVKFILKIAKNGVISDNYIFPNPTKYISKLKLYIQSPEKTQKLRVEIYNTYGQKVKQFHTYASIGENEIIFDNVDMQGNLLPSGVYYYGIYAESEIYFEPVFGKFIVNY